MKWTEFCMESPISGECGVAGVFSLEVFQMDPGSGMWKIFGRRLVNGPRMGELEDDLVGIFEISVSVGRWWGV